MHTNHLINEKSPYLIQHAHNPVDWYPWGEEAFRRARETNRPVFLSIGYATCHWCHVMARESFEDEETAEALNRDFISIKVDREERPDVDRIYMLFVQAATGSGGWPMTVFLTPDLKPFFGGTYFPAQPHHGLPAFKEVLHRIAEAWRREGAQFADSSADVVRQLAQRAETEPVIAPLNPQVLDSGFYAFRRQFDTAHGGFGGAPKFPRMPVLDFLMRYHRRTGNAEALEMVFATLNAMAHGGIRDHLGGGFHRYSVDERWLVPHFEKMLHDQAQIAASYIDAFGISNDSYYAGVARATLDYVLRDLADEAGGFCCAEDADSPDPADPSRTSEGAFYLWTAAQIHETLGEPDAARFMYHYGAHESGNIIHDPAGEFPGRNILFEEHSVKETAAHFEMDEAEMDRSLAASRAKLFEARSRRPRPSRDGKVLVSWNGLMISALAKAARVLQARQYLEAAQRASRFIMERMYSRAAGTLVRRYCCGEAAIPGLLEDYAFFVQGLLDLHEASPETQALEDAVRLTHKQLELFEDKASGAFFDAPPDPHLILRLKNDYDGAEPSGNSIAISNLLRLSRLTERDEYSAPAMRALRSIGSRAATAPEAVPQLLAAIELAVHISEQAQGR